VFNKLSSVQFSLVRQKTYFQQFLQDAIMAFYEEALS